MTEQRSPPPSPGLTTLVHGEEDDGGGTQIEVLPITLPEPQGFLASVADIMARLRAF
jgi:hypothetical protein